ncbi:type II toxin-antitoxin system RelE/ParE family toxin [Ancylobacter oerskovii]|uniref:Type II toxin-antitoxin system RelE/ParE family toxin n=1 Tax=Ancylobacter oerskovii TaxID=459519 RepID=A0ABW4Z2Z3_9HYPH|nr:type II toxin-antitoxin system RelE/ParE family toxin [Ancylobacter oerskovii]MBS7546231.1 type II toxin-antitoxin system RelE/ParE family toxin [Ancylobacter oerskovii]
MKIVRTSAFDRSVAKAGASRAEVDALELALAANPDAGDVIPGMHGARKVRFAMRGKGKRGGGRCIYVVMRSDDMVFLLLAYAKADQEDMTQAQRQRVAALMEAINE